MLGDLLKNLVKGKAARERDGLALADSLVQNTQYASATGVLDAVLQRNPQCAPALLLRGAAQRTLGRFQLAIADLTLADRLAPDNAQCQLELALCYSEVGDAARAIQHCTRARLLAPTSGAPFGLMCQLTLPGESYFQVLTRIFDHCRPRTYVEIGIFQGESLHRATSAQAVVGIDPNPKIESALAPHIQIFKAKSDDFFASNDLRTILGGRSVDMAFIDGMHQFEFAMRDFANLERYCQRDSVVLVHDCYPVDAESAGREPRDVNWSGDVWRLTVLLKKYRPDLLIHTIATAPTGLAVIQNLDPASSFLMDNHDRLVEEFLALDYAYLDDDKAGKLNLFRNDWAAIRAMVKGPAH